MSFSEMTLFVILVMAYLQITRAAEDFNYLCNSRSLIAGAGYNSHPRECDKYIQCHWDVNGNYVAEVRQCAFGTHWSIAFHTCLRSTETSCVVDPCATKPDGSRREGIGNCRGFWECSGGKSVSKCCAQGRFYSQANGCMNNTAVINCTDRCFDDFSRRENQMTATVSEFVIPQDCDKRVIPGDPTKYEQHVAGYLWKIVRPCSLGTQFVQSACNCVQLALYGQHSNLYQVVTTQSPLVQPFIKSIRALTPREICQPSIHLPFSVDHTDESGNNVAIGNENVIVENAAARFNGINSRLIIGEFPNLEPTSTLVVKIRYTPDYKNTFDLVPHALISNDNCHFKPSIILADTPQSVEASVGTWAQSLASVDLSIVQPAEREMTYKFTNSELSLRIGNTTSSLPVSGHLRNIRCPLHIGYADSMRPFKGVIHEVSVYVCDPGIVRPNRM